MGDEEVLKEPNPKGCLDNKKESWWQLSTSTKIKGIFRDNASVTRRELVTVMRVGTPEREVTAGDASKRGMCTRLKDVKHTRRVKLTPSLE